VKINKKGLLGKTCCDAEKEKERKKKVGEVIERD
jgi:hypothetical protein